MLEKLKGYRTYIVAILGLIIVPILDAAMRFNAGNFVRDLFIGKLCGVEPSQACIDLASQIGSGVSTLYVAIIGALIVFFRAKGKSTDDKPVL